MLKGYLLDERYEIIQTIGGGGMANVYLAKDLILNREVAIKVLRMEYANDAEFIERFDREAKAATSVSHPNIVNIYDVGEEQDDHIYYMVMEYVDGMTLKEYIVKNSPISVEETLRIMRQLASAISHAHANGLIHRDIKPQNVLIDHDGNVKVTDFGIAIALSATSLTQTNSILGSVQYISPEQARGGKATKKSDIYSLGIVMFEMLTGQLPFSGQSPVAIALKHLQEDTPSIRALDDEIPKSVENIVLQSTTKDPTHRYQSVDEMLDKIDLALEPEHINEPKFIPPVEEGDETKAIPAINEDMLRKLEESELDQEGTIVTHAEETKILTPNEQVNEAKNQTDQTNKKKKSLFKRKRFWIPLILFLLLAGAAITYFFVFTPKDVKIPDLEGYEAEEAIAILEELKLETDIETDFSEDHDEGSVIKTRPGKNRTVKEGAKVTVVVSDGKNTVEIEDFVGKSFEQVKKQLEDQGFKEVIEWQVNSDEEEGTITKQVQPDPGDNVVPSETTVIFEVSAGPETDTVPDVLGLSRDRAINTLENAGFKVTADEEYSDSVSEGNIVSQSPEANEEVKKGSTVKIVISLGKEPLPPMEDESKIYVSFNPPEDENGEKAKEQTVTIYLSDSKHSIDDVYREEVITKDTEFTIPFVINEGESAQIKVLRDGEEIINNTIPFKE